MVSFERVGFAWCERGRDLDENWEIEIEFTPIPGKLFPPIVDVEVEVEIEFEVEVEVKVEVEIDDKVEVKLEGEGSCEKVKANSGLVELFNGDCTIVSEADPSLGFEKVDGLLNMDWILNPSWVVLLIFRFFSGDPRIEGSCWSNVKGIAFSFGGIFVRFGFSPALREEGICWNAPEVNDDGRDEKEGWELVRGRESDSFSFLTQANCRLIWSSLIVGSSDAITNFLKFVDVEVDVDVNVDADVDIDVDADGSVKTFWGS